MKSKVGMAVALLAMVKQATKAGKKCIYVNIPLNKGEENNGSK